MTESAQVDYAAYLRQRSMLGKWYRDQWLYPRLSRVLRGKTLDVGCGIGDMLAFRHGTIGVDINQHNVEFCRQRGVDARLMHLDLLPFDGQRFDSVLLDNVLEHIVEPAPLLTEIRRVLEPGGRLLVGVPGRRGQGADPDHKVYYDETELAHLAKRTGFKIERFIHMPLWRSELLSRRLRQYCIYSLWLIAAEATSVL